MHLLQAAARLRRDRDGKHVRRHPHRRSLHAGGLPRVCCPRHRSAPQAAAGCSNPSMARRPTSRAAASPIRIAAILSAAMLLRHSLQLETEALAVEAAVSRAIEAGALPADLAAPGVGGYDACRRRRGVGATLERARSSAGARDRRSSPRDPRCRPRHPQQSGTDAGAQPRRFLHARMRHAGRDARSGSQRRRAIRRA